MDRASSAKLAKFLEEQTKRYGSGLTRQDKSIPTYEVIPTGSLALDYATVVGGYVVGRIHLLWGAESMGKGHPVTEPVLTPTGWREVGDLEVGDEVIGSDGQATAVTGVFDRGELPVYRVTMNDGAVVVCDADHLWRVKASKGWVTYSVEQLLEKALQDRHGANRYAIPMVAPVQHPQVDLPIDPYLLGALLANGYLAGSTPVIRTNDEHVVEQLYATAEIVKEHTCENSTARGFAVLHCNDRLRLLGLSGKKSATKFIPEIYLHASEAQRRRLLAGLMDCDGCSGKQPFYSSRSPQLAAGVVELVRSLGGVARSYVQVRSDDGGRIYDMHNVTLSVPECPFTTPAKVERFAPQVRLGRRIRGIEAAGVAEVRCISVAAQDSLYVARDHVVTHNTTLSIKGMAEAQKKYPNKLVGYIDMEQTFDWRWAEIWGLDLSESRFTHWFPESSEQASNMLRDMIKTGLYSEIVVDSIGGMIAKDAMDKDAEEYSVGRNAQVITRMCQSSSVLARKHRTVVLLISQVRADFKSQRGFDTFAGPKNMRHSQTMRLAFQRTGTYLTVKAEGEDEPIQVGQEIRIKVEESKVAPKGRRATCLIINKATKEYGPVGLNVADEAVTVATRSGVNALEVAGSWYTLPDGSRHNGRPKVLDYLRSHPDVVEQIRAKALEAVKGEIVPDETVEFTPDSTPELETTDA